MPLVTKCGVKLVSKNRLSHKIKHYDTRAVPIVASAENSLKQLRTDYLDLLLIHRPDLLMDADEVATAFSQLRQSGKVLQLHQKPCNFPANSGLLFGVPQQVKKFLRQDQPNPGD